MLFSSTGPVAVEYVNVIQFFYLLCIQLKYRKHISFNTLSDILIIHLYSFCYSTAATSVFFCPFLSFVVFFFFREVEAVDI